MTKIVLVGSLLLTSLKSDRIKARKVGDKLKANLLGVIIGEADQHGIRINDEKVQQIIKSTLKAVNDRIEKEYSDDDLSMALAEAEILQGYLPKEMDDQKLYGLIEDLRMKHDGNVGKIMQQAKTIITVEGYPFNGKKVSEFLKLLEGK